MSHMPPSDRPIIPLACFRLLLGYEYKAEPRWVRFKVYLFRDSVSWLAARWKTNKQDTSTIDNKAVLNEESQFGLVVKAVRLESRRL